jgi:tRNA/rRNA methyltransferase
LTPPSGDAPDARDGARFVLVRPSHAGNVGAAARAMKVMGFSELVLVAPRRADVLCHEEAVAMASGAADVLARARVVAGLDEALAGITHACATAMTPRDFGPPTLAPRPHFETLAPLVRAGRERLALVFGGERHGLANEEVWRCHACVSIPTHPAYGSLNLAQALQLLAYEWRQALGGFEVVPRTPTAPGLADAPAVAGALAHWQRALERIGFLDPAAPKKLLPRLRLLLQRARPRADEIHILRGIARAVEQQADRAAARQGAAPTQAAGPTGPGPAGRTPAATPD